MLIFIQHKEKNNKPTTHFVINWKSFSYRHPFIIIVIIKMIIKKQKNRLARNPHHLTENHTKINRKRNTRCFYTRAHRHHHRHRHHPTWHDRTNKPSCVYKSDFFPPGRSILCNKDRNGPTVRPYGWIAGHACCDESNFCNLHTKPRILDYRSNPPVEWNGHEGGDYILLWLWLQKS